METIPEEIADLISINQIDKERVARAICIACEENPDHSGDAAGNQFRWQDYLHVADAAISAMSPVVSHLELDDFLVKRSNRRTGI